MFSLTGATVTTASGHTVLSGIDLDGRAGEIILLVGASGSGKTTLLETIGALRPLERGQLALFGDPVVSGELPLDRRARIGYVPQDPGRLWLRSTVAEELSWPVDANPAQRHRARDPAALLPAAGLDLSYLSRDPRQLSGGEQRLVALAAALTWSPGLVLLDEPTAGLSQPWADAVVRQVESLRTAGVCVVIATHDVDHFAHVADRVAVVEGGRVAAHGTAIDVFGQVARRGLSAPVPTVLAAYHELGLPVSESVPLTIESAASMIAAQRIPMSRTLPLETSTLPRRPRSLSLPTATLTSGEHARRWIGIPAGMAAGALVGLAFFVAAPLALLAALFAAIFLLATILGPGALPLFRQLRPVFILAGLVAILHVITFDTDAIYPVPVPRFDEAGVVSAVRTVFRLVGPVAVGLLLVAQSPPATIARDLSRLVGALPYVRRWAEDLGLAVSIVLRLVPLLRQEVRRCQRAQRARGIPASGGSLWLRAHRVVSLAVPVTVSTLVRANGLAVALYLRGFGATAAARDDDPPLVPPRDVLLIIAAGAILALVVASTVAP